MIPKIIHYCWFGSENIPKNVQKCIESWGKYLPDYTMVLWNEKNTPMNHPFVKSAYQHKKYAFVSDFCRLWALYSYGGIYLDTDMFLIKNLDPLLDNKVFFGYEKDDQKYISAGIIGAESNNELINRLILEYNDKIFDLEHLDKFRLPLVITNVYNDFQDPSTIKIYPYDFFYPLPLARRKDKKNMLRYATTNTYAIHLWDKSWFTTCDYVRIIQRAFFRKLKTLIRYFTLKA